LPPTRDPTTDPAVQRALTTLKRHFTNAAAQPIRTPYYITQLQVLYETDFFPWVTADAIKLLVQQGFLKQITKADITPSAKQLPNLRDIHFVIRTEPYNENPTLVKKRALNIAKLVNKYSDQPNSATLGTHLEGLVRYELKANGFNITGTHTSKYKGKEWTQTGHDLDFIAEHSSGKLNLGVEVKNTLDMMEPNDIDTKIDISHYLGLVPVFAVRWIKPYIDCIKNQGGFCWVFKTQIYPPGKEPLVQAIFKKLSVPNRLDSRRHPLQFPLTVRTDIPEKSVKAFVKWVERTIPNPPQWNPEARCGSTQMLPSLPRNDSKVTASSVLPLRDRAKYIGPTFYLPQQTRCRLGKQAYERTDFFASAGMVREKTVVIED
jgi:hypothetical protein